MKILVIEDNQDILEIIGYILSNEGHEIISCADGSSVTNLKAINPDLILIDQLLPNKTGSDLCLHIRAMDCCKDKPIVLISTLPNLEKLAGECGADAYISKPFDIEELVEVINGLSV